MAGVSVRIRGLSQVLKALDNVRRAEKLPDIVGTAIVAGVKLNFVKGTDPDTGKRWTPIKNRKGEPLRDKGGLQRTIHHELTGTGYNSRVTVGSNLIYAATHQFGDPNRVPKKEGGRLVFKVMGVTVFARKVSIPQRRFIPETSKGLDRTAPALRSMVEKYLQSQWK